MSKSVGFVAVSVSRLGRRSEGCGTLLPRLLSSGNSSMAGSANIECLLSHSVSLSDEYVVSLFRSMHFSTPVYNAAAV